jgi:hypothetical protein
MKKVYYQPKTEIAEMLATHLICGSIFDGGDVLYDTTGD